jgi:hypothetical protein
MHLSKPLTAALALSLSLAALGETPAPGPEELPGPPLAAEVQVPPGARADVLLWKRAIDLQNDLTVQRARGEVLLRKFLRERHDGRLAELLARAQGSDAQRLREARQHLGFAWKDVNGVMGRRWPVDPRLGCRSQFIELEGALQPGPGKGPASDLPPARLGLQACLQKLSSVLDPLRTGTQQLTLAFAEAEALLAPPSSPPPTGGR